MARARLLKPGFFTNSALGRLPMGARLVFQGLWCVADREGRLVDDPVRLKVEILPYDRVNADRLLDDLQAAGFIVRYESAGGRFIQVLNFSRHQSPHVREPASLIPAPGQPGARIGPAPGETGTSPSDPVAVIDPVADPDPVAVAVADPGPPPEDPLPPLLRDWERSTGTLVTPTLADWLDSELAAGTPAEWLSDAIAETGANGIKAWKYTRAIIERWRVQGREEQASGSTDRRGRTARQSPGRRPEETCRVSGQPHDWSKLDGWCAVCTVQEPITEESLRRRGLLVE